MLVRRKGFLPFTSASTSPSDKKDDAKDGDKKKVSWSEANTKRLASLGVCAFVNLSFFLFAEPQSCVRGSNGNMDSLHPRASRVFFYM